MSTKSESSSNYDNRKSSTNSDPAGYQAEVKTQGSTQVLLLELELREKIAREGTERISVREESECECMRRSKSRQRCI